MNNPENKRPGAFEQTGETSHNIETEWLSSITDNQNTCLLYTSDAADE